MCTIFGNIKSPILYFFNVSITFGAVTFLEPVCQCNLRVLINPCVMQHGVKNFLEL